MMSNKFLLLGILLFLSMTPVLATITTYDNDNSFVAVKENTTTLYNISISAVMGGITENITKVEVILPPNISYASVNGTGNSLATFTYASNKLTWTGSPLIINGTKQYFWFRALSSLYPGNYMIDINTYNTSTIFEQASIGIIILDTQAPEITILSPESKTYTTEFVSINVTLNEEGKCWYSVNQGVNVTLNSYGGKIFSRNVSFADGKANLDIYCRDTALNWNHTSLGFKLAYTPPLPLNKTTINTTINQTLPPQNTTLTTNTNQVPQYTSDVKAPNLSSTSGVAETKESSILKWTIVITMGLVGIILLILVLFKSRENY